MRWVSRVSLQSITIPSLFIPVHPSWPVWGHLSGGLGPLEKQPLTGSYRIERLLAIIWAWRLMLNLPNIIIIILELRYIFSIDRKHLFLLLFPLCSGRIDTQRLRKVKSQCNFCSHFQFFIMSETAAAAAFPFFSCEGKTCFTYRGACKKWTVN